VRPANLIVGPLTVKTNPDGTERRRPAPDAVVRLAELGLVPMRPPAIQVLPEMSAVPYLPPERVDGSANDPRGDIYELGATLYFLLTGRPPFTGDDPTDLLNRIRSVDPPALPGLRPDLPTELMGLVNRMMDKVPDRRPPTAADVETALAKFCRTSTVTAGAAPMPIPMAAPASGVLVAVAVAVEEPATDATDGWGIDPSTFSTAHAAATASPPRRREMTAADKTRTRLLFLLGGLLHLTAIGLIVAWAMGAFTSTPEPEPTPTPKKDDQKPKSKQKPRT
jgi:serine/threonine protein kinase